jgi:hypothetical protein
VSDEMSSRDRIVDDLLAESSHQTHTADSPCVDPELLAAWSEGMLAEPDAAQVELHLSSCADCQAVLAAFVRSEPVAAGSPIIAAPGKVVAIDQRRHDTKDRWPNRHWLLTSGAGIAAALVVWFAVAGRNPVLAPARETTAPTQLAPADRVEAGAGAPAIGSPPTASRLAAPAESARSVGQAQASKEKPALAKQQVEFRSSVDERRQAGAAAPETAGRPPDADAMMDALSPAAANRAAFGPPPPPAPAAPSPAALAEVTVSTQGTRSEAFLQSSERALAADPRVLIRSADGAVQWRIRADNRLERAVVLQVPPQGNPIGATSATAGGQGRGGRGGRTQGGISAPSPPPPAMVVLAPAWEVLELPSGVILTAASAPAADVCWLVGRSGAIFVTTAAGPPRRITAPDTSDFVGVTATSARSAAVTTSTGRIFTTEDGGLTWR